MLTIQLAQANFIIIGENVYKSLDKFLIICYIKCIFNLTIWLK